MNETNLSEIELDNYTPGNREIKNGAPHVTLSDIQKPSFEKNNNLIHFISGYLNLLLINDNHIDY